jgi:Regulator of chromosome condensation (RCC1) repeat
MLNLGILGLGAMNYQPIPKLVEGVKRAVSVAAGGDYTLVLTSASVPPMPFISAHGPSIDISRHTTTPLKTDNTPSKLQNATEGNLVIVGGLYNSRRNKNIVPQLSPTLASSSLDSAESVDSDDDSDSDSDEEENAGEEDNSVEEFVEEEVDSDDETFQERLLPQENKQLGLLNALTPGNEPHLQLPFLAFHSTSLHFTSSYSVTPLTSIAGCERRLLSLQELCEQRIAASVDTRNAVALLAHAESIHAKALTEFCSQFIHR